MAGVRWWRAWPQRACRSVCWAGHLPPEQRSLDQLNSRAGGSVSACSHAPPCQMVPPAGMLAAGFRRITRAGSKAAERTGTARRTPTFCRRRRSALTFSLPCLEDLWTGILIGCLFASAGIDTLKTAHRVIFFKAGQVVSSGFLLT